MCTPKGFNNEHTVPAAMSHRRIEARLQGTHNDGEPREVLYILCTLPRQLRLDIRAREVTVAEYLHVERVAVVPTHELLLARLQDQFTQKVLTKQVI